VRLLRCVPQETTWLGLAFEYQLFKSTGVKILVEASLGAVFEALDEHETAVQQMLSNRFVGFFESAVASWKGRLGGVRATLDAWVEVQRSWCSLESIFLGSEDIREQLPEDAKRFDSIDASFKEQMGDASATLSPVDACLKDGRMEAFQAMQAGLELCSRSLADYLETKRKKFPRFYFISSAGTRDGRDIERPHRAYKQKSQRTYLRRRRALAPRALLRARVRSVAAQIWWTSSPRASIRPPCRSTSPNSPTTSAPSSGMWSTTHQWASRWG
jgi:hypothetical protein